MEIQLFRGTNIMFHNYLGPHFLCWISGVVPFHSWLIDQVEWKLFSFWLLLSLEPQLFFFQPEISHVLNVTTPESQHRKCRIQSISDRPKVWLGQTVWQNFYCAVWPKWQTFFLYYIQCQWHPFISNRAKIGIKLSY